MAESTITREGEQPQKQGEKALWYMHVAGPDDVHAVPDFWTGLAWAGELNAFIAARAAKEKWAADDNWPLTQATIRRWQWSADQHATLLARELSERQEHAEKRAAALVAKPADPGAMAKLTEIPPAGSEERAFWLEAAVQHGFLDPQGQGASYFASPEHILTLMSEARKQGQRDVLGAGLAEPIAWAWDYQIAYDSWDLSVSVHRPAETPKRRNIRPLYEVQKQEQWDALTTGITAGLEAAIRGIDATILNMGGECTRRGGQDSETGEVSCEGEEDRGCACSEALELGARLIKNLRSADVAKIAALATGGAQ